jgi:hypothetical protein
MFTNFRLVPAPLAILAVLATGFATVFLLAAAAVLALAGRAPLARRLFLLGVGCPAAYAVLLLALGVARRERTLPVGQEKHFCEVDCHIANAVVSAREEEGTSGRRIVVALLTRFDEATISPWRPNSPLAPNPRRAELVDRNGARYPAEAAGLARLAAPLRPGESYITDLVFAVPPGARDLRLSLVEAEWPSRLLLGHEIGPLGGETSFALR